MQDPNENTKEIGIEDLVPNEKDMEKKEIDKKNKKAATSKKSKKGKKKKKFKPVYLVPIIFIIIVAVVMIYVWQMSRNDGPVYGDRCEGITAISETAISDTVSQVKESKKIINDLSMTVNCKTIKVTITMADGMDEEDVEDACEAVLTTLDGIVGLSKSDSNSQYSDLLGTLNGKTQYHVDFTIKGDGDFYPVFASKHPSSDKINFTYNTTRDPELVEKLHEQQDEDDSEDNSEE